MRLEGFTRLWGKENPSPLYLIACIALTDSAISSLYQAQRPLLNLLRVEFLCQAFQP